MSELAGLLELLHGAGESWKTVRLVLRRWGHTDLSGVAMRRHADRRAARGASSGTAFAVDRTGGPNGGGPVAWEMVTRAWIDRTGDRARIETNGDRGQGLTVRVAALWWSYSSVSGSISNESEPEVRGGGSADFDWMLEPSSLLPVLDFNSLTPTEQFGRPAVATVAVPRVNYAAAHGPGAHVAYGADDVLLVVDCERGVVLRAESRIAARPFALYEVTEVTFDEELDEELFRFVSPDGSPVRSAREVFAPPEHVSVEGAAERASFAVLIPKRLPEGWTLDASYLPQSQRPPRREAVTVRVLDGDRRQPRMWIHQEAEPGHDTSTWETVERGDRTILISRGMGSGSTYQAKVELEGTFARINGNIEREPFLEIGFSLASVPTELPPII